MRAAQYDKEKRAVLIRNIAIPQPGDGQYQVKVAAASLCHSDLMMSQRPDGLGPVTIGHEGVGIISKVHPSVEDRGFKVGDRIGMFYIFGCCFSCDGCKLHGTFCSQPREGGTKIQGLQAHGFMAEYVVIDWRNAIHLPASLPIERMSPLFCAGVTAFHAIDKCELKQGQWIAIVGCGGLGQVAIQFAKAMGLKVVGFDIYDQMLDRARQSGADETFNPRSDPKFHKQLRKMTQSRGCHAAAVFSDSQAAYDIAQRALDLSGVMMVVGLPEKPLQVPAVAVSLGAIRVKGASNGTVSDAEKAVEFAAKHRIIPDVKFRRLEDMPQMWDEMAQGKAEKRMVVVFGDEKSRL